jgi:XRE family transcriptional regulator, fatty acid utilization regulator
MSKLSLGELVRDRREAVDLTRKELARRVGTSTSTIARLELSDHAPRVRTLTAIAAALDIPLSDLMAAA